MKTFSKLALVLAVALATPACAGGAEDVTAGTSNEFAQSSQALTTGASSVRIGNWNIKRLGQSAKRMDLAAQVIDANFDVVALEEVMTPAGLADLMKYLPGWSAALSDHAVGANGYMEYYAVLTRDGAASVTSARIVDDAANEWVREPMVTCLQAGNADFCLVSSHVIFGDLVGPRDQEILALNRLVTRLRNETPNESDYIVLGDFNRSGSAKSFDAFEAQGFRFSDDGLTKTTLGSSNWGNPYDHVILDRVLTNEWTGTSSRVDSVATVCGGNFSFCSSYVSDHAPLGIVLNTAGVDDD